MMAAGYMRFGSVGIKSAYQKYVAEATATGNYELASKLLSTGSAAMFVLSIVGLLPVALFSRPLAQAAGVPPEFIKDASNSISLLALIIFMANIGAAFEAIVMGVQRIDLLRKLTIVLSTLEAGCILIALKCGYGLFAMATIMGVSQIVYVGYCYTAAGRILPELRIGIKHLSPAAIRELIRFGATYQLVNILEIVYGSIVPIALLRVYGSNAAGIYAVASRVVGAVGLLSDSFLTPVLSGASMVYASDMGERSLRLIVKAYRAVLVLSVLPFGFTAVFGATLVYAWTAQTDPLFRLTFWLMSATALFRSLSLLSLVLYRASGEAIIDNVRQFLRILLLIIVAVLAPTIGFYGLLSGLGIAEVAGLLLMLIAIHRVFPRFPPKIMIWDCLRIIFAAGIVLAVGSLGYLVKLAPTIDGRSSVVLQLIITTCLCIISLWPAVRLTRCITEEEQRQIGAAMMSAWPLQLIARKHQ